MKWNEYEGPLFTLRASAGVILDAGAFTQDDASREQFDLKPDGQVRDFRVMLNGRIKTRRAITWSAGFMCVVLPVLEGRLQLPLMRKSTQGRARQPAAPRRATC